MWGRPGKQGVPFTYYGRLVGIPASYTLAPGAAYHKLDVFYDLAHDHLHQVCEGAHPDFGVQLYSYSMVFFGEDVLTGLRLLHGLYMGFLESAVLLSGAVVPGMLAADPRFSVRNFYQGLAPGGPVEQAERLLEGTEGARLLVDSELASAVLPDGSEWDRTEGYARNYHRHPEIALDDPRRFLVRSGDVPSHELLYYYRDRRRPRLSPDATLLQLSQVNDKSAAPNLPHYQASVGLIQRCLERSQAALINPPVPA